MDQPLFSGEETHAERKRKYDEIINSNMLSSAKRSTRQSIWILIAIGVVNLLYGGWYYFDQQDVIAAVLQTVIAAFYLALALYAIKEPYQAILSGAILYGVLIGLNALVDPATLLQGIILKVAIIAGLIKGISAGREVKELQAKPAQIQSEKR